MVHVRAFLINSKQNARGWRVNATTLVRNVLSFIKRPLILKRYADGRIDHREWDSSLSASDNFRDQERNAIGHIDRVLYDRDTDSYYADIDITNPAAENWIRAYNGSKIPIAVSPQIIYDRRKETATDIKEWFGSHLAIVGAGAYGPQAVATNLCEGDCPIDLPKGANASGFVIASNYCEDAPIPVVNWLQAASANFDTSLGASDGQISLSNMSMTEVTPPGQQTPAATGPQPSNSPQKEAPFIKDVPTTRAPVTVPQAPATEQKPTEQNVDYKQLSEQLKTELESAKLKIAEGQTLRDTLTEHEKKLAKYDADTRERNVRDMIPVFLPEFLDKKGLINSEAVDGKVKDFLKRGFTPEDVRYMYAEKVAAFEDALNAGSNGKGGCSCGKGETAAASGSMNYPVPEIQVPAEQQPPQTREKPWFVNAAKFLDSKNGQFSKRPGRVL